MNSKKQIKIFCPWELSIDFESEKQVELYVDQVPPAPHDGSALRIVFLLEPPTFLNLAPSIISNQNLFDHVLTYNQAILSVCPKAVRFEHGTCGDCWMKEGNIPEKEFNISTVVGFKMISEGHHIRRDLWMDQGKISSPKRFFLSKDHQGLPNFGNEILGADKSPMFSSQFHIAIESTKMNNYFTEKLIDAFITKTVPIYYGCSNVGDWFNTKGMFRVNSSEDIINVCNGITHETYNTMLPFVEDNYERAKLYVDVSNRLKTKIKELTNV